jgi:hypothetical protein
MDGASAETVPQRRHGTVRKRKRESESESDNDSESKRGREDRAPDVPRAIIDGRIKCVVCDRTFTWLKSCIRHEASHTAAATFACATCPKVFTRQDGLRLHRCPVAQLAKVLKREELAEQAGMLERRLVAADAQVQEARRELADRTNALTALQEQLATAQRALAIRPDVGSGLRYAPAPLVLEQEIGPRGQRCRACLLVLDPLTGAVPRGCHGCGLLYHSRCVYLLELDPRVELFCAACLRKYAIDAQAVEAASFEAVGLPRALDAKGLALSKSLADGTCLFASVAEGTQREAGDAPTLMRLAGACLLELVALVGTPVQSNEDADMQHWRYTFEMGEADQPKFKGQVKKAAALLAKGTSVEGTAWNSAAMDLVPQVLPWLLGRPVHVWAFNYARRDLLPTPLEFQVRRVPGHPEPTTTSKRPLLLARSKVGVLPHYDLIVPKP